MRVIKFRGWNRLKRRMNYRHSSVLSVMDKQPKAVADGRLTVMQYTGLKDKNGKEIYEGDVMEAEIDGIVSTGAVVYMDDWGRYQTEFRTGNKGRRDVWSGDKVIGNIYENPELLTKSE